MPLTNGAALLSRSPAMLSRAVSEEVVVFAPTAFVREFPRHGVILVESIVLAS